MPKPKIKIDVEKAIEMHKNGKSIPQIGIWFGCSKVTVKRAFDRVGYMPRKTLEERKHRV